MRSWQLIRWSGAAAMLGGTLWVLGAVLHALKPRGCVADECATMPMRESGAVDGVLALSATVLMVAGVAGLVLLTRQAGRFGRTGKTGVQVGVAGLAVLVAASLIQALLFDGDFPWMPYFVMPALLAVIIGFLLVGVAILRAGVLPRWSGVLLILGSLAMLASNEQTAAVLLVIPFGLAWVAVGFVMCSHSAQPSDPLSGVGVEPT